MLECMEPNSRAPGTSKTLHSHGEIESSAERVVLSEIASDASCHKRTYKKTELRRAIIRSVCHQSKEDGAEGLPLQPPAGERLSEQADRLRLGMPRRLLMRDRSGKASRALPTGCESTSARYRAELAGTLESSSEASAAQPAKWSPAKSFQTMVRHLSGGVGARMDSHGCNVWLLQSDEGHSQGTSLPPQAVDCSRENQSSPIPLPSANCVQIPAEEPAVCPHEPTTSDTLSGPASERKSPMQVDNCLETAPGTERRSKRIHRRKESGDTEQRDLFRFPEQNPGAVSITLGDLRLLQPGGYLNDNVIEFWLKFLERYRIPPYRMEQLHFMSTFFYKKITSVPQRSRSDASLAEELYDYIALRWFISRGVDLFTKRMLFIPIHHEFHWSVAVVCNLDAFANGWHSELDCECRHKPCILYLDSMRSASPGGMTKSVRSFLTTYARVRAATMCSTGVGTTRKVRLCSAGGTERSTGVRSADSEFGSTDSAGHLAMHPQSAHPEKMTAGDDLRGVRPVAAHDSPESPLRTVSTAGDQRDADERSGDSFVFDGENLPLLKPKVPLQENGMDCGIYMLMYIEHLAWSSPESYQLEYLNACTSKLFAASDADAYRLVIERVMRGLASAHGIENLPEYDVEDVDLLDAEDV